MNKGRSFAYATAAALALGSTTSADAVIINIIDAGGTITPGSVYDVNFKAAKWFFESIFKDDITVDLKVNVVNGSTSGALGLALTSPISTKQTDWRAAIIADAKTSLDSVAIANLANFSSSTVGISPAVQKALGIYKGPDFITALIGADSYTSYNVGYQYDYDTRDGIQGVALDFLNVVLQELGHGLGFSSGVRDGNTLDSRPSNADMFRYKDGEWDITWGGKPYFSIDGGANPLFGNSYFTPGDDGRQPSHWRDAERIRGSSTMCGQELEPQIGGMAPTANYCQIGVWTANDLAVFDAIGWDVAVDVLQNPGWSMSTAQIMRNYLASVPEPSTWAMMIFGFGAVGAAMRRRPRVSVRFV